ncbi:hypothetical protein ACFX2J_016933 [Malus domestica]
MPNALPNRAQASYSRASHVEQLALAAQPALVVQLTPAAQPALVVQLTPAAQLASAKQPTLMAQPALAAQPDLVAFQAAQIGLRLVQLFPTSSLWAYDGTGGIFTTFLRGFDIFQFKSCTRSLPHFHCSRRHISSKFF